jgi:hypothetical protein
MLSRGRFVSILTGFIAIGILFVCEEYLYGWYLHPNENAILQSTIYTTVGGVVLLWWVFPSPMLVGLATLLGLCLPHVLIYWSNSWSRPEIFLILVLSSIQAGATHLIVKSRS